MLDDRRIDERERAELVELAGSLGISPEQRTEAHRSYVASIIAAARRDGIITEAERTSSSRWPMRLNSADVAMPEVTRLPVASSLRQGMRVCFTGEAMVRDGRLAGKCWNDMPHAPACSPVRSVTKKGCDLLVTADPRASPVKRAPLAATASQ